MQKELDGIFILCLSYIFFFFFFCHHWFCRITIIIIIIIIIIITIIIIIIIILVLWWIYFYYFTLASRVLYVWMMLSLVDVGRFSKFDISSSCIISTKH